MPGGREMRMKESTQFLRPLKITHLILVTKDKSLKISTEDVFVKWDEKVFIHTR